MYRYKSIMREYRVQKENINQEKTMLYSEFLIGTEAPDNAYTYAEYKRIEKIYNADNNLEKSDAYAMYQKPEGLTQELLLENQKLKSKVTEQRFKIQDLEKEIEQLKKDAWKYKDLKNEAKELKKQIQRSYDDIMYHMFDKMGIF